MAKEKQTDIINETQPIVSPVDYGENRRLKGDRLNVNFPVVATTLQGLPIQGYSQATNLSWAGMLIETNFPLNVGDELFLDFNLPPTEYGIQVKGRVVRKEDGRILEEATIIGILFTEIDPNARRMLNGYVLERLPDK